MFTGIIEAVGTLAAIQPKGEDISVRVKSGKLDLSDVKLGDSIATNGVCLTVVELTGDGYVADLSLETLQRSSFAYYQAGQKVNLERALTPDTVLAAIWSLVMWMALVKLLRLNSSAGLKNIGSKRRMNWPNISLKKVRLPLMASA